MSDNLGIITEAAYCFVDDVVSCAVLANGIIIGLKPDAVWTKFKSVKGLIDISVQETSNAGVSTFSVSGTIKSPRHKFATTAEMILFRTRKVLVKVNTPNGDTLLVGDKQNPVKITHKIINPSSASTMAGVEYTLSGVMTHPELPLL